MAAIFLCCCSSFDLGAKINANRTSLTGSTRVFAQCSNELPLPTSCQQRQLLILALNQGLLPSPTRHSSAIFRRTSIEQMNNDSYEQSLPPPLLVYKRAKYAALQLTLAPLSLSSLSPSLSASLTVGLTAHLK